MSKPSSAATVQRPLVPRLRLNDDLASEFETDDLRARVVRLVGGDKRVLELACGASHISRALQEHGCRVVAVEPNPEMAEKARPYCERVIVGELDQLDSAADAAGDEGFDVVVAVDVLPHLQDPAAVLGALKGRLRPGGYLVVAVPNIAHGSVRLALLQGRFCYGDTGLLDKSHLRFYTKETLFRTLDEAGFAVGHMERQELMIDRSEVAFDAQQLPSQLMEALAQDEEARTYQFIVVAHPLPWPGMGWLQERFLKWSDEKQSLVRERDALRSQVQSLHLELAECRESSSKEARVASKELGDLRDQAERERAALSGRLEILAVRDREWREKLIDAHDQLLRRDEEFQASLQQLVEQRERLAAERLSLKQEREQFLAEREALRPERDHLRAHAHHLAKDRDGLLTHIQNLEERLAQTGARLAQISDSLAGRIYLATRKCYRNLRRVLIGR